MDKVIVTTTISPPTQASIKYSQMDGWRFVVVGDRKTPRELYNDISCSYLTPQYQEDRWKRLSDLIGWDCPERKTMGVLYAYEQGADIIAIVDDDNIPMDNWGKNILVGSKVTVDYTHTNALCFDPYSWTNYKELWHRGFPISLLGSREEYSKTLKEVVPSIQSGLVNEEPDIDAICRWVHRPFCVWELDRPVTSNAPSPFNSQNTIFTREVARDYFMMCQTGRMTDIWASFYVQAKGFIAVHTQADVIHKRHPHSTMDDFNDELLGYRYTTKLLEWLRLNPENISDFIPNRTYNAMREYKRIIETIDGAKI